MVPGRGLEQCWWVGRINHGTNSPCADDFHIQYSFITMKVIGYRVFDNKIICMEISYYCYYLGMPILKFLSPFND